MCRFRSLCPRGIWVGCRTLSAPGTTPAVSWHLAHRSCPEALQARCPHTHRQGGRQLTVCETSNHRPTVHRSQSLRQRPQSPPVQMPRQPATAAALWFQARQKLRRRSVQPTTCLRIGVQQRHDIVHVHAGPDQGV